VRRIALPTLLALIAVALVAAPARAQSSVQVSFSGRVTPGQEIGLTCPENYTLGTGVANFYRDPNGRVAVALNVNPTRYEYSPRGDATVSAFWTVPRGARFASATAECFQLTAVYIDETFTLAPGQETLVECPGGYWLDSNTVFVSNPEVAYTIGGTWVHFVNQTSTDQTVELTATCRLF
jgi:hypothetical protein